MNDPNTEPSEPEVARLLEEGLALHGRGELAAAEARFRAILERRPGHFAAAHQLGVIFNQRGDPAAAAAMLGQALQANPRSALAHLNLGVALWNLQRPDEALAHYRLSRVLNPRNPEIHLNLAITLRALRHPEEALACLDEALRLQPDSVKAMLNRGNVLQELHRAGEALADYDWALALQPGDAHAHSCRGAVLLELLRPHEALDALGHALEIAPDHADALLNRGVALLDLDRAEEALASIDASLARQPEQADALMNRGNALVRLRRLSEALTEFDRSLALQPGSTDALLNRGLALHLLGRHEQAIADFDRVLALQPGHAVAHSAKIFVLDYRPDLTFERHQEERRAYCLAHARDLPTRPMAFPNDRSPNRPLVLGYVSADFKRHSAAASFAPVLHHHRKDEFKIVCYSGVVAEDDTSRRFHGCADSWVRAWELSDDALAARIREDRVDILIDLSGHSYRNRLLVFARKPAPVQVTAWGHGGGTGLPMVDYQFTDPVHIPAEARPLFAERLVDLPCCITFEPPPMAPPIQELPADRNGFVTFGSLNRSSKITASLLELWAGILASVPRSKLLLKDGGFDDPRLRADLLATFSALGIGAERIVLRGYTPHQAHLSAYNEVDIVLDTFPQNGGITTWESLWMGAPVLAMLGNHASSRTSAAILGALGLDGWVARNEAGYAALAAERASDPQVLAQFRRGIRARIEASPAGNAERYTRAVEAAYRCMWKAWLSEGRP